MKVNIGGIVPLSTVDWPGKSTVSVFFNGCPFRCPYCHNPKNITEKSYRDCEYVKDKIKDSKNFVSAIAFLGGEPTMQPVQLKYLAKASKNEGLLVGVHTNAYYPKVIKLLNEDMLVDKYFVDIKAPLIENVYRKTVGILNYEKQNKGKKIEDIILRSIKEIDDSSAELELKTTVFPGFIGNEKDIENIAEFINANIQNKHKTTYIIQQGKTNDILSEEMRNGPTYTREEILKLGKIAKEILSDMEIYIRTDENGREKI